MSDVAIVKEGWLHKRGKDSVKLSSSFRNDSCEKQENNFHYSIISIKSNQVAFISVALIQYRSFQSRFTEINRKRTDLKDWLTSFTHPQVFPNLCEFLSFAGHKRRYFKEFQ